jgi:CheY-like chemotaxis protein
LARLGLAVDLASNGVEALDFLSRNDYALVIMDCVMPVMSGIEATRRIRDGSANSRNPDIPIIAITADAMPENLKTCKLAGMNDCLTKPASMAAVREIIQKWLPVAGEASTA